MSSRVGDREMENIVGKFWSVRYGWERRKIDLCIEKKMGMGSFFYYYYYFFFKKKDIRKCIWMSDVDGNKNQLDFLLV